MRWPWVSRLAYDTAVDERDRLRAVNDRLSETIIRITRREAGLPEVQPEKREPQVAIPPQVWERISGWGSAATQAQQRILALQMYRELGDWNAVLATMEPEEG